MKTENSDLERKIVEVARETFIEKGYVETSMSEIAARVGINRPVLHYYFRTKDKMFQAVFGSIILSVAPKVFDILYQSETPVAKRVEKIVDVYYSLFLEYPRLPIFILKEINRDASLLIATVQELKLEERVKTIFASLQKEMDAGRINPMPFRFLFFNLYGLLIMPFLTREISFVFLDENESFENMLALWRPYIISQMCNLLEVK
ncbi:MAG: TetR/AcrR family transcriptional regulator [Paludibacteraceae bacterium]